MNKIIVLFVIVLNVICIAAGAQTKKPAHPAQAMPDMFVNDILKAMKNQYGDDGKLSIIQGAVKNNTDGLTVNQELRLLNQFSNDDSKLQCAKFLYAWSVDYKNYAKIQYNLNTTTAQKALNDYIKKQGGR
ncbi:DUF4476 domain-containing protein [Mucilaginibacter boryungensis]|uniref:DUF4476 domain-containing protein n=1 Tax=Mucilaginibacter boryungensis TaxID=768480 RepID=A0ABR9XC67_9SPHI|nr:DUF4476 domain-containing protein [Mucilaginibacter boryungensis]MBE9664826.1 DUF4476 domain-containing protein [Mucilaginibacter boryungensis]